MIILLLPLFLLNAFVFAVVCFWPVSLLERLTPARRAKAALRRAMQAIAQGWSSMNTRLLGLGGFRVDATTAPGLELRRDRRYLVLPNHQSWSDIFVLQTFFGRRTALLTFFLKRQLRWVPVFGHAWKSLGFPFMERHDAAAVARDPSLRVRDLETTRRFCDRIRTEPFAVVNFVEGTRRTERKAARSPYRHLLAPKAGGIAVAMQALEGSWDEVLDVTIRYPSGRSTFIDLLMGKVGRVRLDVRPVPPGEIPRGDYLNDPEFVERFRTWLNELWQRKDARFEAV
jgi:1-acyl-sn-glycerol-3-phosphate acyltransferase